MDINELSYVLRIIGMCEEHARQDVQCAYDFSVSSETEHVVSIIDAQGDEWCESRMSAAELCVVLEEYLEDRPTCEMCGNKLFGQELTMTDGDWEICPGCVVSAEDRGCDLHHEQKERDL